MIFKILAPIVIASISAGSYIYFPKKSEEKIDTKIKIKTEEVDNKILLEENKLPQGFIGEVDIIEEEIEIKESPFLEKKPEPKIIYIREPEVKPQRPTNTFSKGSYISYDKETETDLFQKEQNEDNSSTIASRKYNLSQIITTNKFIPATLVTAINSEIATEGIVAQIEKDIYGYDPKEILLPRGSQLEGRIESLEKNSTRANISWYKIITPKGKIIILDSASFDSHGARGMSGELDTKIKDRYGASILFSLINAATNLSIDANNQAQLMVAESMQRSLLPVTNQILKENFDIKPTVRLKQGARLIVKPFQNIIFGKESDNIVKAKLMSNEVFNK